MGRASATVLGLATAGDPLPSGGRLTVCVEGHRVAIAYRRGERTRVVCHRLALAVEKELGAGFAVRFELNEGGPATIQVARSTTRIESTTAEAALERLASLLGNIIGISGMGATQQGLVVYAESDDAADAVRVRLPELSFLRWPVEVSLRG